MARLTVDAFRSCPRCRGARGGESNLEISSLWQAAAAVLQRAPGETVLLHTTNICLEEEKTHSFAKVLLGTNPEWEIN